MTLPWLRSKIGAVLRAGVSHHKDPAVGRRVRLTNVMALTLALVVLAYFPILYWVGSKLLAWSVLLIVAAYVSVLPLNHAGHHTLARLVLVTFLNGAIFFYSGYLGQAAGGHLYMLATACLPIIIASVRERTFIVYGVGLSILLFEILLLFRDRVFPAPIIGAVAQLWIYRAAVVPTTFLILLAQLIYFSASNERAEERLERNREFRLLLDSAGQGFLTVDAQGRVGSEWSRIIETWLGEIKAGVPFAAILRPYNDGIADWFELSWETLFGDRLPVEVAIDQLPKGLQIGAVHLGIEYHPFFLKEDANVPDRVLIVLSNITSEVERRKAEDAQQEVLRIVDQLLHDRTGFREFQQETTRLLTSLTGALSLTEQKLIVHTLKGSCSLFGVRSIAERCEALEDRIAESGEAPGEEAIRALRTTWDELCERVRPIINGADGHIELRIEEYHAYLEALRCHAPHRELSVIAESWRFEPTDLRFQRFAEQARALARRLNKDKPIVSISGGEVRLDPTRFAPFFSAFVHVLRNCIDHGLEAPEERIALGKPAQGRLSLWASSSESWVIIGIADDGRGIDWERVAERARSLGLPAATREDLTAALYAEGLSTREEVSSVSGRGVGMSALKRACDNLGGHIIIQSTRGQGTRFEFHIPTPSQPGHGSGPMTQVPAWHSAKQERHDTA